MKIRWKISIRTGGGHLGRRNRVDISVIERNLAGVEEY